MYEEHIHSPCSTTAHYTEDTKNPLTMMTNGSSSHKQAAATTATATDGTATDGNDGHRTNGTTLPVSNPSVQPNLKTTATTTSSTQLLSDPLDEGTLSSGFVLLRKQIEIFEATEEDVMARRKFGGIISVQQVGIRCTHCAHLPHGDCAPNAACFPTSITQVYQAARNWQRRHMNACTCIPVKIKEEFKAVKGKQKGKTTPQYWVESCQRKGLYDVVDDRENEDGADSRCPGMYYRAKMAAAGVILPSPALDSPLAVHHTAASTTAATVAAKAAEELLQAPASAKEREDSHTPMENEGNGRPHANNSASEDQVATLGRAGLSGTVRDREDISQDNPAPADHPGGKSRRTSYDDTASTSHNSSQQSEAVAGTGEPAASSTKSGNDHYTPGVINFFYGGTSLSDFIRNDLEIGIGCDSPSQRTLCSSLTLQAALNLTSHTCQDPSLLTGGEGGIIPDQASAIEMAQENGNINAISLLFQLRIFLTYLFGKYQVAGQLVTGMKRFTAEENPNPSRELWASELLYKGLVAAALARDDDRARWMPTLLECRERLEEICVRSSRHRHGLKLLEAELAYTNGVKDVAARLYDEAIYLAKENGLLHQTALASERAGIFHSSALSNEVLASSYRNQARGLYLQWGAYRKATTLTK